jgi:hypothetical protein
MAKDSDRLRGGFGTEETGGALSGLLAEEDEFDRRALWRLGTWAAASVGAVIVALIANQSTIGIRHEQSASADLLKQAQQLQLTARESQNETRRLASAVDTLNSDRDRLYSRVAVLEQGLDSVTGAIARQGFAAPSSQAGASQAGAAQASASQANPNQASAGQGSASQPTNNQGNASQANTSVTLPTSATAGPTASSLPPTAATTAATIAPAAPAPTASVDPPAAKPSPAPAVSPVTVTAAAVVEKQDKQAPAAAPASEPIPAVKSAAAPPSASAQPSGSLMASKSMMAPPDAGAGKLIEPAVPPKVATNAPMSEVVAAVAPKAPAETGPDTASPAPEVTVQRTEFGVDVGGANSISGLRALWRGLIKSRTNAALTKLRPIIVIKENTNGLGMQLRLVAGPITDAAAAAKICASLTVSDRSCSTAVFEGQRLAVNADEADKTESSKAEAEPDNKPTLAASKSSGHRHYYAGKHPRAEEPPPKPEPSTFSSLIFGKRKQD